MDRIVNIDDALCVAICRKDIMRILTAPFRAIWAIITKIGRISLWLLFLPLGLWRSIRHGRKKNNARLLAQMKKAG